MPSSDKDRRSGRLGRLLAALPVQTGFPTSLADLVVKNHGRLKKHPSPSSKRRKGGVPASPSPSPPPPSPSPPPPPPAAAVSPDPLPAQVVRREESGAFGLGLGFLAFSGVVSLALLVIWSRKVVAAVTVASFTLFLLESLKSSSLPRRRRAAATETQLCLDGRGRVSPIREVETETEPSRASSSDSDILVALENSGVLDDASSAKGKTKRRSWKKLVASAKKLHKGRKGKEGEDRSGPSSRSEGDGADATVRGDVEATDSSGSRRGMGNETDAAADEPDSVGSRGGRIQGNAPADLTKMGAQGKAAVGIRFPAPALVAVVLVGLVAGKLPAVALTMLCAAFFSSAPRLPCRPW
jgi:hypothetical protein